MSARRRKVCLISNLYPPHGLGGAEAYAARAARALAERADVVVLTTCPPGGERRPRPSPDDGVRVYRFFPANLYFLPDFARHGPAVRLAWHTLDIWNPHTFLAARAVLARERPDLVYLQNPQGISTAALSAAAGLDIPVALMLHDQALWCRRGLGLHDGRPCGPAHLLCRLHERVQRRVTRSAGLVLAPSAFTLETHRRRGFFPHARRARLPLPLDPTVLPARARTDDAFELLYVGQLAPHKGVDVLLHAVLAEPDPRWRLRVAGDGELAAELGGLAAGDPRITFLGRVSPAQRASLMADADALVIPSRAPENAPVVAIEAFQAGLPVIASAVGGIPELVVPGDTGLLVPPDDPPALRAALRALAHDAPLRRALAHGAEAASAAHDLDAHVRTLLSLFEELRAARHARVPEGARGPTPTSR